MVNLDCKMDVSIRMSRRWCEDSSTSFKSDCERNSSYGLLFQLFDMIAPFGLLIAHNKGVCQGMYDRSGKSGGCGSRR